MGLSAQDIITIPPPKQQKIESKIKLMKKSFTQHGMVALWTMTNSVVYSFSTETHPLERTDYLWLRSFMATLPRIPLLPTITHFLKSSNVKQKLSSKRRQHKSPLLPTTMRMLTPLQRLKLVPMLLSNILVPSCGTLWNSHPDITQ